MTVKELKEKLNQFDDNFFVLIPNIIGYSGVKNVTQGVNGFDNCVFLDDYTEED